jgi:DNA-binding XRE family transcriptional regulator
MDMDRGQILNLLRGLPRHERTTTLRSLYNLSQDQLASICGVRRGTISTWEQEVMEVDGGRGHEPSKACRIRMGAYFGLPSSVFSDEWGTPTRQSEKKERGRKKGPVETINVPPPVFEPQNVKRLD